MRELPDFVRAPNQGGNPKLYEIENAAIDHEETLSDALFAAAPWSGKDVVDLGCGTGYWLPGYLEQARAVIGVEPDSSLIETAEGRDPRVQVLFGSAEHIPLADAFVDVVHARFAYFFPPGCDAGLAEVLRVLRPGRALVVIDNDQRWGDFADLLGASVWAEAQGRANVIDEWWAERGASRQEVRSSWQFDSSSDLADVLHLEFPPDVVGAWLAAHPHAAGLSYGYVLFTIRKPRPAG